MFLRQSTASQEIPLGPFVDDTDGKTAETALTIANTDIKLWKGGTTTEVNKNSGGATHIASGRYSAVLDATDTDTVGMLEVNVAVSGALPVRRQFYVLEEAVFDALFASGASGYQVPIWSGASATVNLSNTTIKTATDVEADTANIQTRIPDALVSGRIDASVGAMSPAAVQAVWDALNTALTVTGSIGKKLADVVFNWNTTTPPTVGAIRAEIDSNSTQLAKLGTPAVTIAGDIAAVKTDTATAAAEVVKIPRRASAVSGGAAVTKTNTSVTPNESLTEVIS